MFTNRKTNLFLTGSLAVALIVVLALAVAPSAAAPTMTAISYIDFAQRHSEMSKPSIQKAIGSDFYERHPDWVSNQKDVLIPVTGSQTFSDYYERHPELFQHVNAVDTSDYYLRHR